MEHWFDRLSQPHSRRTMLRSGALAAAALILPAGRVSAARAAADDPCFKPCTQAAGKAFLTTRNGTCEAILGPQLAPGLLTFGTALSVVAIYSSLNSWLGCTSNAEVNYYRAVEACRGSECGDPATYPGGQAPRKPARKCTPGSEIPCGDDCCDIVAQCCPCNTVPTGYICCAANSSCDCCPKH